MFKNHPRGLPVLFFTEMWERFGFYLMLGIFTLYMKAGADAAVPAKSGLGLAPQHASDIYGTYIALVYLTPFIGGLLADRILGYRRAIVIGGVLMGLGYSGLAIPGYGPWFFLSLLLIIIGNGFFKPNISTLVGNLYNNEQYKEYKDAGFNIFYMGINIGAFVCNFVAAYLRNTYGWGYAFLAAGIGMFFGVGWFLTGMKHTAEADVLKPTKPGDQPVGQILAAVFGPAAVFAALGWFIPSLVGGEGWTVFGSKSNDAFLFACVPVTWFYYRLWRGSDGEDKERIGALLPLFAAVIAFWAIFHQNGDALTTWADRYTRREIPEAAAPLLESVGGVQRVDTGLREITITDDHGNPVLGPDGKPAKELGPDPYFNNVPKSEWPPPPAPACKAEVLTPETEASCKAAQTKLVSTELFQSVNAFFVVFLTPFVVGFFAWMRRKNKEPSTPAKISIGLAITALSTLVMVAATFVTHNGAEKGSALWLIGTYGVITVGELCLSPMGLSLVSKLSPARLTALMMGGWFLSTSIGNKLSGILSGLFTLFEHKSAVFLINFGGALVASLLIVLMLPRLRRVMNKYLG
ncbi:proton-dependent oligopeptide transporter, POT family [Nannocystis exedens]|uniref:Proton-dependent oligopeptide transporter, POT family n=1 Tax=Nannocystis exedens TaxID=54 RepID=A0A1I2HVS0_9BACT|nr:peptide MFS transporter [Nannocystis exedens]PCC72026.1 Di-/tripeptide transporter [Nannocystis exedens]SFF33932.1 proton-dependent oligopeptide transporter, POT family [Nannocystis exedens]